MIATIDIRVNAAHPNIPLAPLYAFEGSPSNVRVRNVPQCVGKWQIDAVSVTVAMPDNSSTTVPAVAVCGCWVATLPSCDETGYCASGLQITASGTDENGAAVSGYCLGVGDVTILPRDAAAVSNGKRYYLHYVAEQPENPNPGDMCYVDGVLKWYDGTAWQTFADGGASIDVVPPSTDPADAGKAADAKATGDALAGKLSKSEAEAGFTEWTISPYSQNVVGMRFVEDGPPGWYPIDAGGERVGLVKGDANSVNLTWGVEEAIDTFTATRTRLPTMADIPTKTSQLTNDSGFLTQHQQLAPIYGGNGQQYGDWVYSGIPQDATDIELPTMEPGGRWVAQFLYGGNTYFGAVSADENATRLDFEFESSTPDTPKFNVTATLAFNPVIGYTLGDQTTKPLQPKGDYAPATDIPKAALASGVQTSLGLADTAVQPAALRYDLITITTGQLQDRAVQKVELNAATTTLVLPALTDLTGKVSDFGIDIINAYAPEVDGTPTPTAASFQLSGTLGTDYHLIVPKGETWSDMTALAAGEMAVYYFTLSTFAIDDLPTWEVIKKVVELVPVPTAP